MVLVIHFQANPLFSDVVIQRIYTDGNAQISGSGIDRIVKLSELTPRLKRFGPRSVNEYVVYKLGSNYYEVTIQRLFTDGYAHVTGSGIDRVVKVSELNPLLTRYQDRMVNESVVYKTGSIYYDVTIQRLYTDGYAHVTGSGIDRVASMNELIN